MQLYIRQRGGLMVSALVPAASGPGSSPGLAVLGQDTWLSQYLSLHPGVGENLTNCGGMTCDALASYPGGVEILLAASCYRNR